MFSIPITVPFRDNTGVYGIDVSIDIDKVASVNPLDRRVDVDVELDLLYDYRPMAELLLHDGRKLPVCEPPAIIDRYLQAYRQIEDFYTNQPFRHLRLVPRPVGPEPGESGVIVSLFPKAPPSCASSEGSTPD
jgi:hypothetical protein